MPTQLQYSMPIKTSGDRPPLFCIHGEPLKFAMRMQADRPVYGVNYAYQSFRRSEMPQTIEDYARLYLADIRAVQPHGPYYICGFSVGGMIAYEIVNQLLEAGEEVGDLLLVEPTLVYTGVTSMSRIAGRFAQADNKLTMGFAYLRRLHKSIWARGKSRLRDAIAGMYLRFDRQVPQNLCMSALLIQIGPVMAKYEYQPMDVHASLIFTSLSDEMLGYCREYWGQRFTRGADVISIGGVRRHLDMMRDPALGQLIGVLDKSVAQSRYMGQ